VGNEVGKNEEFLPAKSNITSRLSSILGLVLLRQPPTSGPLAL